MNRLGRIICIFLILWVIENCNITNELPNRVASGEVTETSAVLWAKPAAIGQITFECSLDPNFSSVFFTKTGESYNPLVPSKTRVSGLSPSTVYYYRASDSTGRTSSGKFKTLPAAGSIVGLKFGVSGDSRGDLRPFYSLSNAPSANLDFFINLGDTIYADFASPEVGWWQARHIDDFRKKYQEVFSEVNGQNYYSELRASTAVFATIDDHEVTNNFAGGSTPDKDLRFDQNGSLINETHLYQNGTEVFSEYHPLNNYTYNTPGARLTDGKIKFYRTRHLGLTASFYLLDCRSFRDAQLSGISDPNNSGQISKFMSDSANLNRTLLGSAQLADLENDLLSDNGAGIKWKFVFIPIPIQENGYYFADDRYEGYAKERNQLLSFIKTNSIKNVVFVTADMHGMVVNNLSYTSGGKEIPVDSFEIITGPISFDPPMGPTTVLFADLSGESLKVDTSNYLFGSLDQKDKVVKDIIDNQLSAQGYSKIGLEDSLLNYTLLKGSWIATFIYGWTEFEVDQATQDLTITTYGIPSYNYIDIIFNSYGLDSQIPQVFSKFKLTLM